MNDRMKLFITNKKFYRCCFAENALPQISAGGEFLPNVRFTLFVINPLRSARPTSLLWRLSVSETGIVDRADQSSYHTLRQIAHGLFGGGGCPPFGIQHILQSNSYQPQGWLSYTPIYMLCQRQFEYRESFSTAQSKGDTDEAQTTFAKSC